MKERARKISVVIIAMLCLSMSVAGPVLAQEANGSNTTNGSGGPVDGNISIGDGNATANNSSNSSGNGSGGKSKNCAFGICIPEFNPIETFMGKLDSVLDGIIDWFVGLLQEGIKIVGEKLIGLINGIPAPGELKKPLTWNPGIDANGGQSNASVISAPRSQAGGIWNDVYQVWFFTIMLSVVILIVSGSWLWVAADPYEVKRYAKKWGLAVVMSILTWFVAPLGLHLSRAISLGLAPDSIELSQSLGKFGLGVLLVVLLAIVSLGVFVRGIATLFAQYFLAHFLVAAWPLAWSLQTTRNSTLESLGESILYMYGLLCLIYPIQSLILRFSFALDWTSSGMSIGSGIFGFIASLVGLYIALVEVPQRLLKRAMEAGMISLGTSKLRDMRSDKGLYDILKGDDDNTEPNSRGRRNNDASSSGGGSSNGRNTTVEPATDGGRPEEPSSGQRHAAQYGNNMNHGKSSYRDGRSKEGQYVGRTPDEKSRRNRRNGRQNARRRQADRNRGSFYRSGDDSRSSQNSASDALGDARSGTDESSQNPASDALDDSGTSANESRQNPATDAINDAESRDGGSN